MNNKFLIFNQDGKINQQQEQRRKEFLEKQTQKRKNYFLEARKLLIEQTKSNLESNLESNLNQNQNQNLNLNENQNLNQNQNQMENEIEIENQNQNQNQNQIEIENLKENQKVDQMQVEKSRKFPKRRQKNKKKNLQKNFHRQFIIPEKLEEIPEDLEENWYSIPIPKEYKRCMIISTGGMTISRQMNGEIIEIFSSLLPGGSFYGSFNKKVFSILDCFYLPQNQKSIENVYYILDVMCWNGCEFYNTEAEFRFFWIASKLQEEPNFSEITQTNKRKFQQLPLFNCNIEDFEKIWKSIEIENEVDSILLYSKKTHYTPGITPLVCQLDPQQLPQLISFLKK